MSGQWNIGEPNTNSVSIYDPTSDSWAEGPALPRTVGYREDHEMAVVHQGEVRLLSRSEEGALAYRGGAWVEITDDLGLRRVPGYSLCQSVCLG